MTPDPVLALRRFAAIAFDPVAGVRALIADLDAAAVPLLAWPLLQALRRADAPVPSGVLPALDLWLDDWDTRHGLAGGPRAATVAAQAWLVQDLHCLADLHHRAGDGDGPDWSERGHRAEAALHAVLWHSDGYRDRDVAATTDPLAALMPLLLLDTPPERVARLVTAAVAAPVADGSPGTVALAWLAAVGLRRHGRVDEAARLAARTAAPGDLRDALHRALDATA